MFFADHRVRQDSLESRGDVARTPASVCASVFRWELFVAPELSATLPQIDLDR